MKDLKTGALVFEILRRLVVIVSKLICFTLKITLKASKVVFAPVIKFAKRKWYGYLFDLQVSDPVKRSEIGKKIKKVEAFKTNLIQLIENARVVFSVGMVQSQSQEERAKKLTQLIVDDLVMKNGIFIDTDDIFIELTPENRELIEDLLLSDIEAIQKAYENSTHASIVDALKRKGVVSGG